MPQEWGNVTGTDDFSKGGGKPLHKTYQGVRAAAHGIASPLVSLEEQEKEVWKVASKKKYISCRGPWSTGLRLGNFPYQTDNEEIPIFEFLHMIENVGYQAYQYPLSVNEKEYDVEAFFPSFRCSGRTR